jgi:hypothetical protein
VFFPLLIPGERFDESNGRDGSTRQLQWQRLALTESIRALEFEYQTGKLSEEDYQRQMAGYAGQFDQLTSQLRALVPENPGTQARDRA